jgi:hypothetical protein
MGTCVDDEGKSGSMNGFFAMAFFAILRPRGSGLG